MAKILNYGSLNIDYVYDVPHFVKAGETLSSTNRSIFAGGKGLNQSVALARAGGEVYHAGAVGKDDSKILTDVLAADKIDSSNIAKRDCPSGHTIIQVDANGQNCIILFGGANQTISEADIDSTLAKFDKGDFMVLQNETSNIRYMIEKAYEKGMKVCFNVSPFTTELLKLPLDKCAYLIVNEIEGAAMADMPDDTDPYVLLDKLCEKFPNTSFVLTLGSRGSILREVGAEPISCRAFKVNAVDTTAAGDTFNAAFLTALSEGKKTEEAIRFANAAASLTVRKRGAQSAIPTREETEEALLDYQLIPERIS